MTAARRRRKSRRPAVAFFPLLAGLILAGLGLGPDAGRTPARAATTELIVSDVHTGLAIGGYDPVAYFTDKAARLGKEDHELRYAGVTWRFRNVGNRAAFAANPEVYMPRFGGYDPMAVGRGASVAGHPELWAVFEDRVYLFFSAAARANFVADPPPHIEEAERLWPTVLRVLAP